MTNNTTFNITAEAARLIALHEAGLDSAVFHSETLADGLWELEFTADELWYTCYVDAETGEAPGLTFAPVPVESYPCAEGAAPSAVKAA